MLKELQGFDIDNATLSLWVFRKRIVKSNPVFTGKWVSVVPELKAEILEFTSSEVNRYTEAIDYSLLAQNNESSLMLIGTGETSAVSVVSLSADQTQNKKIKGIKDLSKL